VGYASHEHIETFSGITESNGDMKPSYSWKIGPNSKPGIFHVNVDVSAKGYRSGSATKTFEVTAAIQNTTITNTTITNTTTPLPVNSTGEGGSVNSTSGSNNNNETNNVFNPLIPSTGGSMQNETAPQEQTGGGGGNNATTLEHKNEDLSYQPIDGNSSSTIIHIHSHTHHSSKHKDGNDLLGGGSGNDGGRRRRR